MSIIVTCAEQVSRIIDRNGLTRLKHDDFAFAVSELGSDMSYEEVESWLIEREGEIANECHIVTNASDEEIARLRREVQKREDAARELSNQLTRSENRKDVLNVRVAELEEECSNLAAFQCPHGYGDPGGSPRCTVSDRSLDQAAKILRLEADLRFERTGSRYAYK